MRELCWSWNNFMNELRITIFRKNRSSRYDFHLSGNQWENCKAALWRRRLHKSRRSSHGTGYQWSAICTGTGWSLLCQQCSQLWKLHCQCNLTVMMLADFSVICIFPPPGPPGPPPPGPPPIPAAMTTVVMAIAATPSRISHLSTAYTLLYK